jgi:hypothetical protein
MKAFRNINGTVVEIDVDLDLNGMPILPPDTTTDPKPEADVGHYVTVVGNSWVQIPIPEEFTTFEHKKQKALESLKKYKDWYLEQPVTHNNIVFDADEKARNRLAQTLISNSVDNYLPRAWITTNNSLYPLNDLPTFMGIVDAVRTAFSTRFFEMESIRQQIIASTNEEELNAITIPVIPDNITISG